MTSKAIVILILILMTLCINAKCQDVPPPPLTFLLTEDNVNDKFQNICDLNSRINFPKSYRAITFFIIDLQDTTFILQRYLTSNTDKETFEVIKKGRYTDTLYSIFQNDSILTCIKYYNKEGQEIEHLIFGKDGNKLFRNEIKYDLLKRVSEKNKIQILPDREFTRESIKITYNKNGTKIIRKTDHLNELYGGTATVVSKFMNKFGQITKIEFSKKDRIFSLSELKWNSKSLVESIVYKSEYFDGKVVTKYTYNELGFPISMFQEINGQMNKRFYIRYSK